MIKKSSSTSNCSWKHALGHVKLAAWVVLSWVICIGFVCFLQLFDACLVVFISWKFLHHHHHHHHHSDNDHDVVHLQLSWGSDLLLPFGKPSQKQQQQNPAARLMMVMMILLVLMMITLLVLMMMMMIMILLVLMMMMMMIQNVWLELLDLRSEL